MPRSHSTVGRTSAGNSSTGWPIHASSSVPAEDPLGAAVPRATPCRRRSRRRRRSWRRRRPRGRPGEPDRSRSPGCWHADSVTSRRIAPSGARSSRGPNVPSPGAVRRGSGMAPSASEPASTRSTGASVGRAAAPGPWPRPPLRGRRDAVVRGARSGRSTAGTSPSSSSTRSWSGKRALPGGEPRRRRSDRCPARRMAAAGDAVVVVAPAGRPWPARRLRRAPAWGLTLGLDRRRRPRPRRRAPTTSSGSTTDPAAPATTGGWCCGTTCCGSSPRSASSIPACWRRPTACDDDDDLHHLQRRGAARPRWRRCSTTAWCRCAPRGASRPSTPPWSARSPPATSCWSTPGRPSSGWSRADG